MKKENQNQDRNDFIKLELLSHALCQKRII